jgi:adenylate kinase
MLNIDVHQSELVKRLLNRGKTSGRSDDNLATIQERINVYEQKTLPVIQFYDKQGKHVRIQGTGTMDEVFASICTAIDKLK